MHTRKERGGWEGEGAAAAAAAPSQCASAPWSARTRWWAACGERRCTPSRSTHRGGAPAVGARGNGLPLPPLAPVNTKSAFQLHLPDDRSCVCTGSFRVASACGCTAMRRKRMIELHLWPVPASSTADGGRKICCRSATATKSCIRRQGASSVTGARRSRGCFQKPANHLHRAVLACLHIWPAHCSSLWPRRVYTAGSTLCLRHEKPPSSHKWTT